MSSDSMVFLVTVAMMNMVEQAPDQIAAAVARATSLGAPPMSIATLGEGGEPLVAPDAVLSGSAARNAKKKADDIRDRHEAAIHPEIKRPREASEAEEAACAKACKMFHTLGLDRVEDIAFKSTSKLNMLKNDLMDDSGRVAASLRIALGHEDCHAARAAITAAGVDFKRSPDGITMWSALLKFIETPNAQLIAHTSNLSA